MTFVPALKSCRAVNTKSAPVAVAWMGPDEARDRAKLDAWCASVGPLEVGGPPAVQKVAVDELAVVTWNAHVGGGDLEVLVSALRRGDYTGGAPMHDFVLLLQEVYRAGPEMPEPIARGFTLPREIVARTPRGERQEIRDAARSLGLYVAYAPAMRNGSRDGDRGNAIAATFPLDDLLVIELPFERHRRMAIAATLRGATAAGAAWQLRVATTHFDTGFALTRGGPAAARRRQAQALIDALSASPSPIIVGGDFNTWWGDDEPAVRELRRSFPDVRSTLAPTWGGAFRAVGPLDHLFARWHGEPLQVRRLPHRFGSDPYPLMAVVRFS